MQALDEWRKSPEGSDMASILKKNSGQLAPPLGTLLAGFKLKRKQRQALQAFRDLFVCVRSEAARFGPDRCGPKLSLRYLNAIWCDLVLHGPDPPVTGVEVKGSVLGGSYLHFHKKSVSDKSQQLC
jgi:hypothetical protein